MFATAMNELFYLIYQIINLFSTFHLLLHFNLNFLDGKQVNGSFKRRCFLFIVLPTLNLPVMSQVLGLIGSAI